MTQRFRGRRRRVLLATVAIAGVAVLTAPRLLPWLLDRVAADIIFRGPSREKVLFLTIDDAPSSETERILAVLDLHEVKATFFITADHVAAAEQLEEIVNRGHRLGNHLRTTHPSSSLSMDEFVADFEACAQSLPEAGRTLWYRPSSDFGTPEQLRWVEQQGYHAVMGTVFPLDHWISSPPILELLIEWLSIDGEIIILHDGRQRGPVTARVLDSAIPRLQERGYRFATLDQLITCEEQR